MANSSIKVSQLPIANGISANDKILILSSNSTSLTLKTISANNFADTVVSQMAQSIINSLIFG